MYIIVTLICVCICAAFLNGNRLSISSDPKQKIKELSNEERQRQIYRNAYFSWLSLKDEV
jgi:hypothetical protein